MDIQSKSSDNAILKELGQRLSRYRLNQNQTQEEIAKEAGIGINTLYRIEQGHSTQFSNVIRLLRALGIINNLNALIPEPPPSPIEQLQLKSEERKRATKQRKRAKTGRWTWGDET